MSLLVYTKGLLKRKSKWICLPLKLDLGNKFLAVYARIITCYDLWFYLIHPMHDSITLL